MNTPANIDHTLETPADYRPVRISYECPLADAF